MPAEANFCFLLAPVCIDELFVSIRKGVNASEELMEYIYFSNKFIAPVKRAKCLYISNENEENNLHSFFERSWMYDYLFRCHSFVDVFQENTVGLKLYENHSIFSNVW